MDKKCPHCDEALVKGLLGMHPNFGVSVIFSYNKKYEKSKGPLIFPHVCKSCGYTELVTNVNN